MYVCDLHAAILTLGARAFQLIASNFHHLLVSLLFFNVLPPPPLLLLSSGLLCVAAREERAEFPRIWPFDSVPPLINFHLANAPAPNNVLPVKKCC